MQIKQIYISNKIIVTEQKIVSRKDPYIYYEINEFLYQILKDIYFFHEYQIEKKLLDYLIDKEILTFEKNEYNPFCKMSDYNRNRLFIQLTNKCNLFCKHCYADSHKNVTNEYFNMEKTKQFIDEAVSLGIYKIDFTGGEVFMEKWFLDLLKYIDSLPITYSIFTNLTLVNDEMVSQIKNLNGLYSIITSLDYFDKQKHNIFRGSPCAYDNTMRAINLLNEFGIKVYVNSIVMNDNHKDIENIIHHFEKKNIEVHLDMIMECGRAEKNILQQNFVDENIEFIKNIISKSKNLQQEVYDFLNMETCGVADTLLFVDHKGIFNICPSLTWDLCGEYYIGNTLEEAHSNLTRINLKCRESDCEFYQRCSYGCRARALRHLGTINGKDILMCKYLGRVANYEN